jgi:hypothetical protein
MAEGVAVTQDGSMSLTGLLEGISSSQSLHQQIAVDRLFFLTLGKAIQVSPRSFFRAFFGGPKSFLGHMHLGRTRVPSRFQINGYR